MSISARGPVLAAAVALAASSVAPALAADHAYDLILRHGVVVDGSGDPAFKADVAIAGGRIAKVGDLRAAKAAVELDATGLVVAPGFINIHAHPRGPALARAVNMLTQGVTTEITNPDGFGPVKVAEQLDGYAATGLAVNVGGYIGFNSVWEAVMGTVDRRATPEEIVRMRGLVTQALGEGAWGLSAGLDYKPAYFADTDEVIAVAKAVAPWRTNFPNHERLVPETGFSSRAGIRETLDIGAAAGVAPVVTHMKAQGGEQGRAGEVMAMIAAARAKGLYAAGDVYPYLAGQGPLAAIMMPAWATEGGEGAMFARFQDPSTRKRIVTDIESAMNARFGGARGVYVETLGRELADIAAEMGASPGEAIVRLLERKAPLTAFLRFGAEADLLAFLKDPDIAIACDCGSTDETSGHPRTFATFPRVLGHYVRDEKALGLEAAVRKMTGLPAAIIGMSDRGLLAPGMAADVAVFDPARIAGRATFESQPLSEGVRFVIVNGAVALKDGVPTGRRGGRVLKRDRHMPTRALATTRARFQGRATGAGGGLDFDVIDGKGALRLTDRAGAPAFIADAFGRTQTAPGWASVTGSGRLASGERRGFVLTVDAGDPQTHGRKVTLLRIEGADDFVVEAPVSDPAIGASYSGKDRSAAKEDFSRIGG